MDKRRRRRVRKEWVKGWQRDRKMEKMSKKEIEKEYKNGERERWVKEEGGVDGVRHREVKAQQVRVVDGQKKRKREGKRTDGENYKYFNERRERMERQKKGEWQDRGRGMKEEEEEEVGGAKRKDKGQ